MDGLTAAACSRTVCAMQPARPRPVGASASLPRLTRGGSPAAETGPRPTGCRSHPGKTWGDARWNDGHSWPLRPPPPRSSPQSRPARTSCHWGIYRVGAIRTRGSRPSTSGSSTRSAMARSSASPPASAGPRAPSMCATAAICCGATFPTTASCAGSRRTAMSASSANRRTTATATRATAKAGSSPASTMRGA